MSKIDLSIIIVNYNVKEFLQNLLDSINKSSPGVAKEIIIIDNASDDGSVEILKEKYPSVCLIANDKNLGFGSANNQGLKIAKGDYILLINPDTIVQEDTFQKLIQFFKKTDDAGLVGCRVLNPDGTLQLACRRGFPGPWTSFCKVTGLSKLFPKSRLFARYNLTYLDEYQTYEVDAISGAFMMMKREVYEKIGGFDSQFFMYGEDLDLCYRCQKAGFKVYYVHSTQIIHYKGESTKKSNIDETKIFYDAMHLFVKKHFSASFIVELILRMAIVLRKTITFINIYKLVFLSIILDFLFFNFALFIAEKIYMSFSATWDGFPEDSLFIVYTVPALIQILVSSFLSSYRKDTISVLRTLYSLFIGFFFLSALPFFFKGYAFSRAVVLISYSFLVFIYPLWRIVLKVLFKIGIKDDYYKSRTLVVGTNNSSLELARKLKNKFTSIHNIVGLIGLTRREIGNKVDSFEVIGSLDNIKKIIRENKIDEVIFSSNGISYNEILEVVSQCQGENVDFKVAGTELDFLVGKSNITMLDDIPLLEISYNISSPLHRFSKTILDYAITIPSLIFIYPFIYFIDKVTPNRTEIVNFILGLPAVLLRKASLVGPRFQRDYLGLYLGERGLTGLWFTEGYDENDTEELEKLDIFYAKNQNIWLDLDILGKSFSKMLIVRR